MQTIAIDFDGVIHRYSAGWKDGTCYDVPVDGVFEAIKELMKNHTVFIFSTRKPKQIKAWIDQQIMESDFGEHPLQGTTPKYGFTCKVIPFWVKFWNKTDVLGVTRRKLPAMVYVDDRALTFTGDWKQTLGQLSAFKTYQQR